MSDKPFVSILMPAKNAAQYLEECIDSIIAQEYPDWELIIVNDHSTDRTPKILATYCIKDNRIRSFENQESGIISALRLAYSHANGSHITRMDADDIMSRNKISELLTILKSDSSVQIATGGVKYFSQNQLGNGYISYQDWLNDLIVGNTHWKEIYKECVIPSPCWMMRREDFESIGGFDSSVYPEDYDLAFRMYQAKLKVKGTSKVLHYWRDYADRTSRTDDHYSDNRFLKLKVEYFLKIDFKLTNKLILWGAGKKGKEIAKLLNAQEIDFQWVTNNPKKIGHVIHKTKLSSVDDLKTNEHSDLIIVIANNEEKTMIRSYLNTFPLLSPYFFC